MRPVLLCSRFLLVLLTLTLSATAGQIPVGTMTYLGETPSGSSVFRVLLAPPKGVKFNKVIPAFFTDQTGRSFVLPPPQPNPPLTYDFLFVTVPGSGFTSCPCHSVSFVFTAAPGTKVLADGKNAVLQRISASFLDPNSGAGFLVPQQSATIYLSIHGHNKVTALESGQGD